MPQRALVRRQIRVRLVCVGNLEGRVERRHVLEDVLKFHGRGKFGHLLPRLQAPKQKVSHELFTQF